MQENIQLSFDFEENSSKKSAAKGKYQNRIETEYQVPKYANNLGLFEKMDLALRQIGKKISEYPVTNKSLIFEMFYHEGATRETILNIINSRDDMAKITCLETVRQHLASMSKQLLAGKAVKYLYGARFKSSFLDEINEFKSNKRSVFCDKKQYAIDPKHWKGICYMLDMHEICRDTVLFMLDSPYIIDSSIGKDVFKCHILTIYYCLQSAVRPVDLDYIVNNAKINKSAKSISKVDPEIAKLVLMNTELFETLVDEEGNTTYILRLEHLNNTQQIARLVYERKNITLKEITAEIMGKEDSPKCISMSTVRKHFPWCVPLGKSAWIYSEDGVEVERIQDVVEKYCREHVRFTMDEIKRDLAPKNYLTNDNSLRCYIIKHCRSHNTIPNYFCYTEAVPQEEETMWMSKHRATTRNRHKLYRVQIERKIAKLLRKMPDRTMPLKDIRHTFGYILEDNGVNVSNLYKIIDTSERLHTSEVDGVKMVKLVERYLGNM